ncbi:hypothetical protein ACH50O_05180 [Methylomonas sp. 2BW1-5-20]|uniref:hypothetical protein n=1 Tax=Methylomonas sp. 2BW1-5-20 TaxID=3376686 RepID=UPI00404EFE1F
MNRIIKSLVVSVLLSVGGGATTIQAAPREAGKNDAAVLKLQSMVKSLTAERDAAKAESTKLAEDLKQFEQLKKDHSAAVAAKEQISGELSAQKNSNGEVRDRLEKTNARLLEVIEKHKEVSQAKADLNAQLAALSSKQKETEQQLGICGEHNAKLVESAKELLDRYKNKGSVASLLQDEPLLQFQSVEMEDIVQRYSDRIADGSYKSSQAERPSAN